MPELKVYRRQREVVRFQFTKEFNVGRGSDNDYNLPDPLVSRRQFSIIHRDDEWILKDQSGEGTVVNKNIFKEVALRNGAEIRLSDTRIVFYLKATEHETSTNRAKARRTRRMHMKPGSEDMVPVDVHVITGDQSRIVPFIGKEITVGTDPSCTVVVKDDYVSSTHLTIEEKGDGRFHVKDLDTTNGTTINNVEVHEADIPLDCFIRIGKVSLVLKPAAANGGQYQGIIGNDKSMQDVYRAIDYDALSKLPVLIIGETGTGKNLVAEAIHSRSSRNLGPFIKVNCGGMVDGLQISELFGHEKGAYTGAHKQRKGAFERASGGTLFLDEIAELSPATQAALLHAMDNHEIERLGGEETIKVDVRIITATNRNLENFVRSGKFREDLYYRIRGACIKMPPLRTRNDDVNVLIRHYLKTSAPYANVTITEAAQRKLAQYSWPGNVRQLIAVIGTAVSARKADFLDADDFILPAEDERTSAKPQVTMLNIFGKSMQDIKDEVVSMVYAQSHDPDEVARQLDISKSSVYQYIARLGLAD